MCSVTWLILHRYKKATVQQFKIKLPVDFWPQHILRMDSKHLLSFLVFWLILSCFVLDKAEGSSFVPRRGRGRFHQNAKQDNRHDEREHHEEKLTRAEMENSAENWATRILVSMLKENKQKIQRKMFWEFNLIYSNETYLLDIKKHFQKFRKAL